MYDPRVRSAGTIHESNNSSFLGLYAWTIAESNPEQLLVFKAPRGYDPRVRSTSPCGYGPRVRGRHLMYLGCTMLDDVDRMLLLAGPLVTLTWLWLQGSSYQTPTCSKCGLAVQSLVNSVQYRQLSLDLLCSTGSYSREQWYALHISHSGCLVGSSVHSAYQQYPVYIVQGVQSVLYKM